MSKEMEIGKKGRKRREGRRRDREGRGGQGGKEGRREGRKKGLSSKKNLGPDNITGEFSQTYKGLITNSSLTLQKKLKREKYSQIQLRSQNYRDIEENEDTTRKL
jgi:hypothetical protein